MMRHKNNEIINVGGGVSERDGMILITGHCEWKFDEKTGESSVIYRGKEYRPKDGKQLSSTGCATHAHAADWDGDGHLDLLVGDIRGSVYLLRNAGVAGKPLFLEKERLRVGDADLRVEGDAGPFTVDWDGDGDLDLLCGSDNGSVVLFENTGGATAPRLAAAKVLIPEGLRVYGKDAPVEPVRGSRSKVCATDWNGDGLLDLLVGDLIYQNEKPRQLSKEEKKQRERDEARMIELQKMQSKYYQKLSGPNRIKDPKERAEYRKKMAPILMESQQLYARLPKSKPHGYVWLFLRKAPR